LQLVWQWWHYFLLFCTALIHQQKGDNTNQMKEIENKQREQERKLQLVGWILFVLCALFFIASSIKNRDILTFIGSVLFLVSSIVFIIPLLSEPGNDESCC